MPKRFCPLHTLHKSKSTARKWQGWATVNDKKATSLIHRLLKGI